MVVDKKFEAAIQADESLRRRIAAAAHTLRPVLDRILMEEIPVEEQKIVTLGGLKLDRHEGFAAKPMTGKVLAVGDGVPMAGVLMPMPYKPGQVVRCSEYGRDYVNLVTGQNGINAFQKGEARTFLIRVADTHGEVLG